MRIVHSRLERAVTAEKGEVSALEASSIAAATEPLWAELVPRRPCAGSGGRGRHSPRRQVIERRVACVGWIRILRRSAPFEASTLLSS